MSDTAAWLRLAALEHEAVWWYQTAAGRPALAAVGKAALAARLRERDALADELGRRDIPAPAPQPAYLLPDRTDEAFRHRSQDLEQATAAAALSLLAALAADDPQHAEVVDRVRRAALAGLPWGAAPRAFPGLQ